MSPIGGVGINLAVQDAVAAANRFGCATAGSRGFEEGSRRRASEARTRGPANPGAAGRDPGARPHPDPRGSGRVESPGRPVRPAAHESAFRHYMAHSYARSRTARASGCRARRTAGTWLRVQSIFRDRARAPLALDRCVARRSVAEVVPTDHNSCSSNGRRYGRSRYTGAVPNPTPGTILGAYRIEGLLGAGSMGEVYRAIDTGLNRRVAIKILSEKHRDSQELRQRFVREGRAVAAISHPNVVQVVRDGHVR